MLWKGTGNSYMQKTGRLAGLFLFLFLLAIWATGFHHHSDDSPHHDCPVCVASHHFSPATVNSSFFEIHHTGSNYEIPKEPLLYNCTWLTLLTSRSPPA
jgi:hypothetical protein